MNGQKKRLPYDEHAEKALLGSLLIDGHAVERVVGTVRPDDFGLKQHQEIFWAMLDLRRQDQEIDLTTVASAMGHEIAPYLSELALATPTSLHAESYGKTVANIGWRNRWVDALVESHRLVNNPSISPGEIHERLVDLLSVESAPSNVSGDSLPRLDYIDSFEDVQEEEVAWLWKPYMPQRKVVLLEGDPGLGKSVVTLVIATALSRGWPLPGQNRGERAPERVLVLAAEDGLTDTVRPRLRALGADLKRIRPILGLLRRNDKSPLTLSPEGVAALGRHIAEYRPALVIIDPLFTYLGGQLDINRGNEVRSVMQPLIDLCADLEVTILALRHLNKVSGGTPLYRGQGNIDFSAAARSVLAVREDPEEPGRSILCHIKSNLSAKGASLAYRIGEGHAGIEFLWEGEVDMSEGELFAAPEEDRNALDDAKRFLHDALFEGAVLGRDIRKLAHDAGISERTLWRAKSRLHVRALKRSDGWAWELPLQEQDEKDLAELAELAAFQSGSQKSTLPNTEDIGRVGRLDDEENGRTLPTSPTLPNADDPGRVDFPHGDAKAANSANSANGFAHDSQKRTPDVDEEGL